MKSFYCDICYKTMRRTSKNKHMKSKKHIGLSKCITVKYTIPKQDILNTENILKQLIEDHNKKFNIYEVTCLIIKNDSKINMRSLNVTIDQSEYNTLNEIINHNKNEIKEIDIYFITDFRYISYKHYLQRPKSILEWTLLRKIHSLIIKKNLEMKPIPIYAYENISEAFLDYQ